MEAPVSLHPDDVRDEKARRTASGAAPSPSRARFPLPLAARCGLLRSAPSARPPTTGQPPPSHRPPPCHRVQVKLLRCVPPVKLEDALLGQYVASEEGADGGGEEGYLDDPTVPSGSRTPTFAACKLFIHNDRCALLPLLPLLLGRGLGGGSRHWAATRDRQQLRALQRAARPRSSFSAHTAPRQCATRAHTRSWAGVPFVLKAGKALNERVTVVRLQLKPGGAPLFGGLDRMRNEIVIRFQPGAWPPGGCGGDGAIG